MNYKLLAFDLDGTFLDSKKRVPAENIAALKAAAEQGVHIVPATGRIYAGLPQELRELPFIRYFICINGAYVYDAALDSCIYSADIAPEAAIEFYEYADGLDCIYDCYQDGFGFMTQRMYDAAAEYLKDPGILRLIKTLRRTVPELKEYLREKNCGVQKLQLHFRDAASRERELAKLPQLFPELLFSTSVQSNIEVNAADAGKSRGLAELCAHLGLSLADCAAIGDGTNDIDMLRAAGLGIAMENAPSAVKAAAKRVTGNNDALGFAMAVENFIL